MNKSIAFSKKNNNKLKTKARVAVPQNIRIFLKKMGKKSE